MFQKSFFISVFLTLLMVPYFSHAADPVLEDGPESYTNYRDTAQSYCDNPVHGWAQANTVVPIPEYPALQASSVSTILSRAGSAGSVSSSEKSRMIQDLNMTRIGEFSGFKTLEIARVQYRWAMDSVFACSIIHARLGIISSLQSIIQSKLPEQNSEIQKKLAKEINSLTAQKNTMSCNNAPTSTTSPSAELVNTATRQYCYYRAYLSYLRSHVTSDAGALAALETGIGENNTMRQPMNIEEWRRTYASSLAQIDNEIARADATLPKAVSAFRDMYGSYAIHAMLVIIYDDFIRLRSNLATYMNASSQLYQKAYNAQDANRH